MIRVIIVDDELLAGAGMQSLLDGIEDINVVKVFTMATEAVEFLRNNVVDIVITDIEMADMNGLDLIGAIRKDHLANGVIIVSSHNDFAYAQEAISRGTDSYLLKYNISGKILSDEIHKVYQKTHKEIREEEKTRSFEKQTEQNENLDYVLCIPEFFSEEDPAKLADIDTTMLSHILDGILDHYELGTLFTPYNRKIFIVFAFSHTFSEKEYRDLLASDYQIIQRNMEQYASCRIVFGLSGRFHDTKSMRKAYEEAEESLNLRFYEPDSRMCFYTVSDHPNTVLPELSFGNLFQNDFQAQELENVLKRIVTAAHIRKVPEKELKNNLVKDVVNQQYKILDTCQLGDNIREKWGIASPAVRAVQESADSEDMISGLLKALLQLRDEAGQQLHRDEMSEILDYIETHLDQKLALTDLAEMANMSIPSFGRKFKDKTGMTLVQYLNVRRIEAAKRLLQDRSLSLEEISERTGFSNANYLVRVFKKVTGQTISDFRS